MELLRIYTLKRGEKKRVWKLLCFLFSSSFSYCGRGIYLEILSVLLGIMGGRLAFFKNTCTALGTRISIGDLSVHCCCWCWWRIDWPWWWFSDLLRLRCPCCPRPFRVVVIVVVDAGVVVVVVEVVVDLSRICFPLRGRSTIYSILHS